ncbi:hypothetical protein SAMN02745206_03051 [Desulfacinum infernum DSM 9756]|uniref:Uncharacterized protein n=1 Tax=Desulfacinum infernum DSM 9756 TaxID=1121391 RepID=A0A1M5G3U5_9BACT|nr:hypothetical protein [Desulfacinum infernum]SHF98393.1 hypothetical protein SAMN02745206_03051 [Desulfacinum infernum DSM 9756]
MTDVTLPAVVDSTLPVLDELTSSLGVPRDILASTDEIQTAWENLPGVMRKIPPALRTESLARMCVAVASGLFDSAINYIWNASIIELREKVRKFGLNVVEQITGKSNFDEQALLDLKDAELLSLCLKLNLITEDGFFFLDQCRDIRNNFSAAHPTVGKIDDHEFIAFANRCAKYALGDEHSHVGVDIQAFMDAVKGSKFSNEQKQQWVQRISQTHEAQQYLLFGSLHGIYCDPSSNEEARVNALMISAEFAPHFTPKAKSDLINRHHEYIAKGDEKRHKASQQFFEKLGMLSLLGEHEMHSMISAACQRMLSVHQAFDNFYNEPPFAERLLQLSSQGEVPDTVKDEFVNTVVTCAVGNPYGVSNAAMPYYLKMIQSFSPREVEIMLNLPKKKNIVGERIKRHQRCKSQFKEIVRMVDPSSVPTSVATTYNYWIQQR